MTALYKIWSGSKVFRIILGIVLVYTLFRLVVQMAYFSGAFASEAEVNPQGVFVPYDLQIYLEAANRVQQRQDLYLRGKLNQVDFYQYPPAYALAFIAFLWLPIGVVVMLLTVLHLLAYGLLYLSWRRIFRRLNLERVNEAMIWTLPVWLIFSGFWSDLGFLNIYILVALLGTLSIEAILNKDLLGSALWLSLILQIKPQWAFAAMLPLFLGQSRFFLKLIFMTAIFSAFIMGVAAVILGPTYVWQQYTDYAQFLRELSHNFPWRGPQSGFLGYNHSITQITVYLLGVSETTLRLALGLKLLLSTPLAVIGLRLFFRRVPPTALEAPQRSLDLAFALYLGAFIWLDWVWELSLAIVIFPYLLGTLEDQPRLRLASGLVFLLYALLDVWRLLSFLVFGPDIFLDQAHLLTDPSIYIPLIMIVGLTFYAVLLKRLWNTRPAFVMKHGLR